MTTYEFKYKCMACGLHYAVYSWNEEWATEKRDGFCPECGTRGSKVLFGPEGLEAEIFSIIPGKTPLVSIR